MPENDDQLEPGLDPQHVIIEDAFAYNEAMTGTKNRVKSLRGWYLIVGLLIVFAGAIFLSEVELGENFITAQIYFYPTDYDMLEYLRGNPHGFQAEENWCDIMAKRGSFIFENYEDSKGEFFYALNKYVYEYDDLPKDMVIIFYMEKAGWNRAGGSELIAADSGKFRVLLNGGKILICRADDAKYLKWRPEDSGIIPAVKVTTGFWIITSLLTCVFFRVFYKYRDCLRIYRILVICVAIISGAVGCIAGGLAEHFYYRSTGAADNPVILLTGVTFCFLIGGAFVILLGRVFKKYQGRVSMLGYGTVMGGFTGIAASCIVHGYLMIAYQESSFKYMLAGSGFGIIAGLVLGWICSGLIRFYGRRPEVLNATS